jgi:hypothetical protein
MAKRNGTDILDSTVEVRADNDGSYSVVSVVTTLEYVGCSRDFAGFLADNLRTDGTTFPKV